ncbi:MAG: sialidase family protein [Gammaproteobacteria bacterium]
MDFIKKNVFLVLLLVTSILHAETTKSPLVAVGSYNYNQPLVIVSDDDGAKWSFVSVPQDAYELTSVTCNGNQCIALGRGREYDSPSIYISHDAKHSWQVNKNISGLPAGMSSVSLTSISCIANSSICNIAGSYRAEPDPYYHNQPLLLRSEDNGKTWAFVAINGFPDYAVNLALNLSCSTSLCVAAGGFTEKQSSDDKPTPIVFISHDTGRSWSILDKTLDSLRAANAGSFTINNVSCDGNNCVMVGGDLSLLPHVTKPFIAYTHDAGKSWNVVRNVWGLEPAIAELGSWMRLVHVHCKDKLCIAGGMRLDQLPNFSSNKPLLLISRDGGKTWGYSPVAVADLSLWQVTFIHSLNCEGSQCVALGARESTTSRAYHFIVASKDGGVSWKVTKVLNPDDKERITLQTMGCSGKNCVIAGHYGVFATPEAYPLFMKSHDGGMTWETHKEIEALPKADHYSLNSLTGAYHNGIVNDFVARFNNKNALKS